MEVLLLMHLLIMVFVKKLLFILCIPFVCTSIINLQVLKYIDLTSQLVKINILILFKNDGPGEIQTYNYILDPDVTNVYLEFYSVEKLAYQKQNDTSYIVYLEKPILPYSNGKIRVEVIYMYKIKTLMNKEGNERIVKYTGNLFFYSPYKTIKYIANYQLNKLGILEVLVKPTSVNETNFLYEYQDVVPYDYQEIVLIYITRISFFVVTKLDRTIDVSHLGSIFVEDNVELTNEGPASNTIYDTPVLGRLWQVLFTYLPASATNIKLFDNIGNNSKSSILYENNYITLRFETRYPLIQSWKTNYVLQYRIPVYEYLRKVNNIFSFKMRVVDHVLSDVIIKNVRTRILLPQDSNIVSVTTPAEFERRGDEKSATALAFNRPTIVFSANNLLEYCVPEFFITYTTPYLGLFKPVLYISAYIEVILLSCVVFRRIDMYLRNPQ